MSRRYLRITYYDRFEKAEVSELTAMGVIANLLISDIFTHVERKEAATKRLRGANNGDLIPGYNRHEAIIVLKGE